MSQGSVHDDVCTTLGDGVDVGDGEGIAAGDGVGVGGVEVPDGQVSTSSAVPVAPNASGHRQHEHEEHRR